MAANFWVSSHCEQWLFDKVDILRMRCEDLKSFSEEEYAKFMIFWANFIQAICTEGASVTNGNKTRMQVVCTAVVYFKRFYVRRSFRDMCPFLCACTSVYLASKVEEHGPLSLTALFKNVNQCLQKKWPNIAFEPVSKNNNIYDAEFIMVEIMDCCLIVFHPHRALTQFLLDLEKEQIKEFDVLEAQAWKVTNDSLRCDACLLYAPHIIALSSIIVGTELLNREKDIKNWLQELVIDFDKIGECVQMIFGMYKMWKAFDEREQVKPLVMKLPKISAGPTY